MRKPRQRRIIQRMERHTPNNSTYSAIFATLLIVLIVLVITYSAVRKIYSDHRESESRRDEKTAERVEPGESDGAPDGTVLYENLTDEEADRIINRLLRSGEKNFETTGTIEEKNKEKTKEDA